MKCCIFDIVVKHTHDVPRERVALAEERERAGQPLRRCTPEDVTAALRALYEAGERDFLQREADVFLSAYAFPERKL